MARDTASDSLAIETTVMALRETIMEYFKHTCIERLTSDAGIQFKRIRATETRFQYQRREAEAQDRQVLYLSGLPILEVQRDPEKLVFYKTMLTRSKELRDVYQGLQNFMEKYLSAVTVEDDEREAFYES
jgi:hypothetical protein